MNKTIIKTKVKFEKNNATDAGAVDKAAVSGVHEGSKQEVQKS